MDTIIAWLENVWKYLYEFFLWLLDGGLYIIKTVLIAFIALLFNALVWIFFTIYDGLLTSIQGFFQTLDFSSDIFHSTLGASMPDLLVWFADQLGLAQCLSLLGTALMLRATLNLIPGVVTRI